MRQETFDILKIDLNNSESRIQSRGNYILQVHALITVEINFNPVK
jgi:hypothetical protein